MPLSRYNKSFGGKAGSAAKAHSAMVKEYGEKKGEQVFYATMNKHKGGGDYTPPGNTKDGFEGLGAPDTDHNTAPGQPTESIGSFTGSRHGHARAE